jgi:predicted RNA-binding protein with RPS1 domain
VENDIDNNLPFIENPINLSEIGKYDKFINFIPLPGEFKEQSLFPNDRPFYFTTNDLKKEKLEDWEGRIAMIDMQKRLDKKIEDDLKQNSKLQYKITDVEYKARLKIEKLRKKPLEKLKKQYNYELFEDYFFRTNEERKKAWAEKKESKLNSSEESSSS